MIQKVINGKGFRGVLDYLFHGTKKTSPYRGNLIASNMAGKTPRQLAKEFGTLRKMRPTLGKAVAHISISLSPEDRHLTDIEFSAVAETYLDQMGFDDCPFVVIRHDDTPNYQHIHIVASRIKTSGECVSDSHQYRRGEAVMRLLEQQFALKPVKPSKEAPAKAPSRKELALKKTTGGNTMKQELRNLIDEAIQSSNSVSQFLAYLEKIGIFVHPHIQGGRISGLIYEWKTKKAKFKGSDLGKKYTWQGIQNEVPYRPDIDFIALNKRKRAEEANHPSIELPDSVNSAYRREYRRMILDDDYRRVLVRVFGRDLLSTQKKGDTLEIELKQGRIIDTGESISADSMNDLQASQALVKLAKEKGWDSIALSGSAEFVRMAMQEAIRNDLPVEPKDEKQEQILNEVLAKLNNAPTPQSVSPNHSPFELPKLTPLKVGEWTTKNRKDDEEEQKQKKKFKYGW